MSTITRKIEFKKGRLNESVKHLHCAMTYQGKEYLGEIMDAIYEDGFYRLSIRHFNGEIWRDKNGNEFRPTAMSVNILSSP